MLNLDQTWKFFTKAVLFRWRTCTLRASDVQNHIYPIKKLRCST